MSRRDYPPILTPEFIPGAIPGRPGAGFRLRSRAGLTLIELLLVMAITAVLASALVFAVMAEVNMQRLHEARLARRNQGNTMEREIRRMLIGARLSTSTTDTTSFFQGVNDTGSSDLGCDRLTFTTTAPSVPLSAINSQDDFETQQSSIGPVGGLTEVSFGTTAVGDPGDRTGLFERVQHPSDGDPTQGGMESDLDSRIDSMGFQFWDGQEWVDTWDTTNGTRRIPEAVQISYRTKGDAAGTVHVFVVAIPASDVNSQNPVSAGTASG